MKNIRDSAGRVLILVENLSVSFDRRVWRETTTLAEMSYQVTVICPRARRYDTKKREVIYNINKRTDIDRIKSIRPICHSLAPKITMPKAMMSPSN